MGDPKLEIQYQYTEKEAITGIKEIANSVSIIYKFIPVIGYVFLGSIILVSIVKGEFSGSIFSLTLGLLFSFMPLITSFMAKRNFRKSPSANSTIKYLINDDMIEIHAEGINGTYSWAKIFKVEKRKKGYLIFSQPRIAHWIPISAMNDESVIIFDNIIKNSGVKYKKAG